MGDKTAIRAQEQDSAAWFVPLFLIPRAISYTAFSYVTDEVATLSIDGVQPTDENVMNNKWIIWSYEHMYTRKNPSDLTKEF